MTRIYIRTPARSGNTVVLDSEVRKRLIKVMRLTSGDSFEIFLPGYRWICRITEVLPNTLTAEITDEIQLPQASLQLILGQAIPRSQRFDWIVEKATELGVSEIAPLLTSRTIARPEKAAKVERWNRIAEQAAGQSENAFPTVVHPPATLSEFLERTSADLKLLLHERVLASPLRPILQQHPTVNSIIFVVGPEGGWTDSETNAFLAKGYVPVHLGRRILRADTAGLVLAAILQYERGDFSTSR